MAYSCKLIECYPGFGPELTTDGNMEDDPATNWPAGGGAAVAASTVQEHGGCQSLRVTDGGAGGGYASQSVTVEAGERYKIEVWGYATAAGDTWRVRIYIGGSVVWTGDTHDVTAPVAWEKDTKFFRIPDGITTIVLRLEVVGAAKVLYFDDVSVRREPPVPMTEIDLQYNVGAGYSLLDRGVVVGRPERVSLYGGRLQLELVRQDDGKRTIPLKLVVEGSDGEDLIDRINALEELLQNATRYREEGWGGEVFLVLKIDDATYTNWFPVYEGGIDTDATYSKCSGEPVDMIHPLPLWVTCEPYWEADVTYDLSNLLDNPGFEEWNGGICNSEPDCWDDYSTAGASGENNQETDTVEEGCEALRVTMAVGVGAGAYQGVTQDITARLRADTEYTLLAWVQNTDVLVNCVAQVYAEGQNSGITYALNSAAAHANYTLVECQFTPNATDIANWVEIRLRILTNDVNATGLVHFDKVLVMEASNVPTGWMSSSYLTNQYDRDPNEVNFLSVYDVPGESEAEMKLVLEQDGTPLSTLYVAKRTRNEPCEFLWQLVPCEGYTTAEGGAGGACQPGLIDAACIDTDKIIDANSPSGNRIDVSFAGNQTMQLRCYWAIGQTPLDRDLFSYYGKFMVGLLARASGGTDTIKISIRTYQDITLWRQGGDIELTAAVTAGAAFWNLMQGWQIIAFPVGTHDDDLWDVGNQWVIEVWAETDGIPTDTLQIAGAYLIPLDEAYLISGLGEFAANFVFSISDLDGSRGVFPYSATTNRYYPNIGAVGQYPTLTPEIGNFFYVIRGEPVEIPPTLTASIKYRPRGIFLRGANP